MSMSRSYNMVEQVLFDILLYLPVMSLLRFKVVCKDWFSLIESSAFVSEHLNHQRDRKEDNLFMSFRPNNERKFAILSGSQYEFVYDIENWQRWHLIDQYYHHYLCGHCDGIVCLGYRDEIFLWNPALNQLRPLPPSLFSSEKYYAIYTSFGFDIKSSDYKLVNICLEHREGIDEMSGNRVEVYNLARDNSWRIINEDDVLPLITISSISSNAISSSKSGMCFWIAYRYDFGDRILLSFDFSEDLFRTMLLPHRGPIHCSQLDFLDDKVVYIIKMSDADDWNFEIWMLHEFGVEESWSKIYKIGSMQNPDFIEPLGISKNGEFLLCTKQQKITVHGDIMFYLYNLHTQQGKFHQNCNLEPGGLLHYHASLRSLKSANNVVGPTK